MEKRGPRRHSAVVTKVQFLLRISPRPLSHHRFNTCFSERTRSRGRSPESGVNSALIVSVVIPEHGTTTSYHVEAKSFVAGDAPGAILGRVTIAFVVAGSESVQLTLKPSITFLRNARTRGSRNVASAFSRGMLAACGVCPDAAKEQATNRSTNSLGIILSSSANVSRVLLDQYTVRSPWTRLHS